MNQQAQPLPPNPPTTTSNAIDFAAIVNRAVQIMVNPKATWPQIKSEGKNLTDIFFPYLVILGLLKPTSQFVQAVIVGTVNPFTKETIRIDFVTGLTMSIVGYAVFLAIAYLASMLVEKLAPNFGGSCSRDDAFALVAYSATAACVGAGIGIIPLGVFAFIGTLVSLYWFYVFYTGIETMTGVPAAKKLSFFAVYIVAMILLVVAVTIVTAVFGFGLALV